MKSSHHQKGFTLIELLVVISIIGVLSSIVLASLSEARTRARNTATVAEVAQVQRAMALFLLDNNNTFPQVSRTESFYCVTDGCIVGNRNGTTDPDLAQAPSAQNSNLASLSEYISVNNATGEEVVADGLRYKGVSYRCADSECGTANLYWTQKGTTSCTKGRKFAGVNAGNSDGVVCSDGADGSVTYTSTP